MPDTRLPTRARAILVGGGIMGVGLAYHLAHEGSGPGTVRLEMATLTFGGTWHDPGQLPHPTSGLSLGKPVGDNTGQYLENPRPSRARRTYRVAVAHPARPVCPITRMVCGTRVRSRDPFAHVKPRAAQPAAALDVPIHGSPRAARVPSEPAHHTQSRKPQMNTPKEAAE